MSSGSKNRGRSQSRTSPTIAPSIRIATYVLASEYWKTEPGPRVGRRSISWARFGHGTTWLPNHSKSMPLVIVSR